MLVSEIEEMLKGVHNPRVSICHVTETRTKGGILWTGTDHSGIRGLYETQPYLDFYLFPEATQSGILVFNGIRARIDDNLFTMALHDTNYFIAGYDRYKPIAVSASSGQIFTDIKIIFRNLGSYTQV